MSGYSYEEQKKCLLEINKILNENNFLDKCFLGFGTFLGTYRAGRLNTANNDWDDIDFNIKKDDWGHFIEHIIPEFIRNGYEILHGYKTIFGHLGVLTLKKGTTRIDFQNNFLKKDLYYHFCWYAGVELVKGVQKKYLDEITQYELEGLSFYGPKAAKQYLVDMYGENWFIPCKEESEYRYWEDSPGIPWDEKYYHQNLLTKSELEILLNLNN